MFKKEYFCVLRTLGPNVAIYNKSKLPKFMACCQTGDKHLPKLVAQFTDKYRQHQHSLSVILLQTLIVSCFNRLSVPGTYDVNIFLYYFILLPTILVTNK